MYAAIRDTARPTHPADAFASACDPAVALRSAAPRKLPAPWGPHIPLCMHGPLSRRQPHPGLPPGVPPPGRATQALSLPATERSVAAARRFSRALLAEWGLHELADDAALLLSELVTNAVVHVPGTPQGVQLVLSRGEGHLVAQVTDPGGYLPRCGEAGPDSENGRGMWLVEQIAAQWGHHASGNGKTVWFTLRLP
ncbi:ATP-binding protein [Streptomyces klenkii]|uniref:ATP-binding protein n=1 Tax=Streptomyces klenkii TaxID=1420899 RepID=A0A3B0AYD9_9ACTN|nr:ATP-binding protein [Streptomyces klenkii]RKN65410.1 ATP-binding protein [Streptomyces klenkii]